MHALGCYIGANLQFYSVSTWHFKTVFFVVAYIQPLVASCDGVISASDAQAK
jgi:hypothetical protein